MRKKREQTDGTALAILSRERGESGVGRGIRGVGSREPDMVDAKNYWEKGQEVLQMRVIVRGWKGYWHTSQW